VRAILALCYLAPQWLTPALVRRFMRLRAPTVPAGTAKAPSPTSG
jgi:hypothetical protein